MTSKKSGTEREKEATRGRLRYLERVQEEKEADEEIVSFSLEQQDKEKELPANDNDKLPDLHS